jgi:hypothetical protein
VTAFAWLAEPSTFALRAPADKKLACQPSTFALRAPAD